jgi:peptidyl-prolyl cis-trans isomerase B (cyclophilin B)
VLAVCGFGLLPVVLGHVALRQVRRTGERGYGLAVAGLVLGYATLALLAAVLVVVGGSVWWGVRQ